MKKTNPSHLHHFPLRRRVLPVLLLAAAFALLCLPFLGSLPLFDPDEGFYPAAAAESLAHGRPLDLTLNGQPRWNKPPLSYALMQGSFLVLGRSEFAARLPSVLEGAALVALLGLAVGAAAGLRAGLLSSVVLGTAVGHQVMSRAAHPEMGLVLGTAAADLLLALWFVSQSDTLSRWTPWAAGLAMGFGFLAKGPVALALPALMLAAGMLLVPRPGRPTWAAAGRAFGTAAAVALALAAPWFLWMGARHGDAFWDTVLGQLGHYTSDAYEHAANHPLYFVPVLLVGFLPWVGLLPGALRGLRRTDPSPAARLRLLMALAAGTSFLFWSLSTSKLPNYGLVFLPPLAAVVGLHLDGAWDRRPGLLRLLAPALIPWALLAVSLAALGLFLPAPLEALERRLAIPPEVGPGSLVRILQLQALALAAVTASPLLVALRARRHVKAAPLACLALAALFPLLVLPPLVSIVEHRLGLRPFKAFAGTVAAGEAPDAPLAVYRKRLPSLSFYGGRLVPWPHTEEELSAFLDGPGPRWLVIRERHLDAVPVGRPWAEAGAGGEWRLLRFHR